MGTLLTTEVTLAGLELNTNRRTRSWSKSVRSSKAATRASRRMTRSSREGVDIRGDEVDKEVAAIFFYPVQLAVSSHFVLFSSSHFVLFSLSHFVLFSLSHFVLFSSSHLFWSRRENHIT
jgi:hypothetical protein